MLCCHCQQEMYAVKRRHTTLSIDVKKTFLALNMYECNPEHMYERMSFSTFGHVPSAVGCTLVNH